MIYYSFGRGWQNLVVGWVAMLTQNHSECLQHHQRLTLDHIVDVVIDGK